MWRRFVQSHKCNLLTGNTGMHKRIVSAFSTFSTMAIENPFYRLRPLNPFFGVEVIPHDGDDGGIFCGFDDKSSSPMVSHLVRDAREHRFLLFRRQDLSGNRQVEISRMLASAIDGRVESTFYKHPRSPHPDVFRVSNDEREGCQNVGRSGWHLDGTFMKAPFAFQTMYFESVPDDGISGDTWFVPLKEFYEKQSEERRKDWDELWMVPSSSGRQGGIVQPLVCEHPFRGDTTMCFHCGPPFCRGWVRLEDGDETGEGARMLPPAPVQSELSDALMGEMPHLNGDKEGSVGLRMIWEKGDFAITDNMGLCHYASESTQNNRGDVGLRVLHRTTIVGHESTELTKKNGVRLNLR